MRKSFAAVAAVVVGVTIYGPARASSTPSTGAASAVLEGQTIDLSQGWGAAQACLVLAGATECFRDRAAMQAREESLASTPSVATATCGSPLRLFSDGGYGGRELDLYDRGYWQNLDAWSFANVLSSYRVGGCGVHLAENANGGGLWYPGDTSAGSAEPALTAGSSNWDNRVSSVYIQ
jgi:hypothetical protein